MFNVTKDTIRVRMAAFDQDIWPTESTRPKEVSPTITDSFTDFIISGKEWMPEVLDGIYAAFNEKNGTNFKAPIKK